MSFSVAGFLGLSLFNTPQPEKNRKLPELLLKTDVPNV